MKIIPSSSSPGRFTIEEMTLGEVDNADRGIAGYKKNNLWGKIQALFGLAFTIKDETNETYRLNKKSAIRWIRSHAPISLSPGSNPSASSIITILNNMNEAHKREREALEAAVREREAVNSANRFAEEATSPIAWTGESLEKVKLLEILPLKKFEPLPINWVEKIRTFPNLTTIEVSLEHLNRADLAQLRSLKAEKPTLAFRSEGFPAIDAYIFNWRSPEDIQAHLELFNTNPKITFNLLVDLANKIPLAPEHKQLECREAFLTMMHHFIVVNQGFKSEQFEALSVEEKRSFANMLNTPVFKEFLSLNATGMVEELKNAGFYPGLLDIIFTQTPNQFVKFFECNPIFSHDFGAAFIESLTSERIEKLYRNFKSFNEVESLPSEKRNPALSDNLRVNLASGRILTLLDRYINSFIEESPNLEKILEILDQVYEKDPSLKATAEMVDLAPYLHFYEIRQILNSEDYMDHTVELRKLLKDISSSLKLFGTALAKMDFDVEKKALLASLIDKKVLASSYLKEIVHASDDRTLGAVLRTFFKRHAEPQFFDIMKEVLVEFNTIHKLEIALVRIKELDSPDEMIRLFSAGIGNRRVNLSDDEINLMFSAKSLTPSTKKYGEI